MVIFVVAYICAYARTHSCVRSGCKGGGGGRTEGASKECYCEMFEKRLLAPIWDIVVCTLYTVLHWTNRKWIYVLPQNYTDWIFPQNYEILFHFLTC